MARAFIGIGSNIKPAEHIRRAVQLLAGAVRLTGISTFYREPAIGTAEGADFYNGVVAIETDLSPMDLKYRVLRGIETALDRQRSADKNAPRTIDLDLLVHGDCVMNNGGLTLPDPDIFQRAFIAVPLYELAPELVIPGSPRTIAEVAASLRGQPMEPLIEYTQHLRSEMPSGV